MEQNKSPLCLDKVDLDYYRSLADRARKSSSISTCASGRVCPHRRTVSASALLGP